MIYTVKMSSDAMIYIPSFIKIDSGIQKLTMGDVQTHIQYGYCISLILVLKIREVG
jgi:hypothetical protein